MLMFCGVFELCVSLSLLLVWIGHSYFTVQKKNGMNYLIIFCLICLMLFVT